MYLGLVGFVGFIYVFEGSFRWVIYFGFVDFVEVYLRDRVGWRVVVWC